MPASPNLYKRIQVLSDPTRVRLLRLLEQEELSVGELTRIVQLPQSTVSRHVKALREGGWVAHRTEGTMTLWHMASDKQRSQRHLGADMENLWASLRDNPQETQLRTADRHRLAAALAERSADSRAFFGRIAGSWDAIRREMFGDSFWLPTLMALLPPGMTVADLGCGTGVATAMLAPFVQRVIAVDREATMLEATARRVATLDNVETRQGELENLPLQAEEVDVALCLLVLHHIEDLTHCIESAAHALRPGGRIIIVDMIPHTQEQWRLSMGHKHAGFSEETLREAAEHANLSLKMYKSLLVEPEAKGPGLFVASIHKGTCA